MLPPTGFKKKFNLRWPRAHYLYHTSFELTEICLLPDGIKGCVTTPCSNHYLSSAQQKDFQSALLHPTLELVNQCLLTSGFPIPQAQARPAPPHFSSLSSSSARSPGPEQLQCLNSAPTLRLGHIGGEKLERSCPVTLSLHTEAQWPPCQDAGHLGPGHTHLDLWPASQSPRSKHQ